MTKKTLSISLYHIYRTVQQHGIYQCVDYLNTMECTVYMNYMIDAVYSLCTAGSNYIQVIENREIEITDRILSYIKKDSTLINNHF